MTAGTSVSRYICLPLSAVLLSKVSVTQGLEADDPPSDYRQKVKSSLTLPHNAYMIYLISFHYIGIIPFHIIRKMNTV